nr:hypothetical protein [Microbacterium ureisolvens]
MRAGRVRPYRHTSRVGLLDDIIDGASSDGMSTTNLLRKVQTLAHRVGAAELRAWARAELDGYALEAPLPPYRGPFPATVRATWTGPFGSGATTTMSSAGTPPEFAPWFEYRFQQGIPELEDMAGKNEELGQAWDSLAIGRYNKLVEQGRVPRIEMMGLFAAHRIVTPALLRSIVESARTKALDLALDLQAANPQAGEVGGPTREDPAIDRAVSINVMHIYGDGANIAQGSGITQTSTVTKGDIPGLAKALAELLADPKAIGEAIAIITGDDSEPEKKSKLQKLGKAIGAGAVNLATGVASDVAARGILELAGQFLGW